MCCVVSEIETTVETQPRELGILETHLTGPDQPIELRLGWPLALELPDTNEVIELRQAPQDPQSAVTTRPTEFG
jgi:hypothetical protein